MTSGRDFVRWALAALVALGACFAAISPAEAAGSATCEEQLWGTVKKQFADVVMFRADDKGLVQFQGCKDGNCPHVLFSADKAKVDGLVTGSSFKSSTVKPAFKCGEGDTRYWAVLTPNEPVATCQSAAEAQSDPIYVLRAGKAEPRVLKLACDKPAAGCRLSVLGDKDSGLANALSPGKLGKACGVDRVVSSIWKAGVATETDPGSGTGTTGQEHDDDGKNKGPKKVLVVDMNDPLEVVSAWRTGRLSSERGGGPIPVLPQAFGEQQAAAIATEALQILGQIVVDRASDAAYRQIQKQVATFLKCPEIPDVTIGTMFPRTCRLIKTVRVQDLASSRVALVVALSSDVLSGLARHLPNATQGLAIERALSVVVSDALMAQLGAVQQGKTSSAADGVAAFIGEAGLETLATCAEERLQVVGVAAAAVVQCRLAALAGEIDELAICPVEDFASRMSKSICKKEQEAEKEKSKEERKVAVMSPEGIALARTISLSLLRAQTAIVDNKVDVRARVKYAVEAAFDAACLFAGGELSKNKLERCPADLDPGIMRQELRLASVMRALIAAAIDGDTNTIIGAATKGVLLLVQAGRRADMCGAACEAVKEPWWRDMESPENKKRLLRALRLLGGLLQYAETYDPGGKDGGGDKDAQHAARTKILESLTREMTNREGREDDNIFSLGGSLRLTAGMRADLAGNNSVVPWGPLSLPLGFGFQSKRTSQDGWGFHLELSIVDLGQYLSFQDGAKGIQVREPEPEDMLSPSVTVGAYTNADLPFFVALTMGYSPSFEFQRDTTRPLGSFNFCATAGLYVPLFDLN